MNRRNFAHWACATGITITGTGWAALAGKPKQPNLLIIHTDEHNFRTLGCYREQLSEDQGLVWGKGVKVDTPNIDNLAREGALCTNYYASSPVCTPSRASFVSGLYPQATGAPRNDMPMHDHVVTFAEILKQNGYATAYVGKWHLDGAQKPGVHPERRFGFDDNRHMYNRGHWKMFQKTKKGSYFIGKFDFKNNNYKYNIAEATEHSFATDFLTDRAMEIIERDKDKPFCLMLSIPDPHSPNTVRAPYDTMYTDLTFQKPRTMLATPEQTPGWNVAKKKTTAFNQHSMAQYFGMVKCIDDNVGKILNQLKTLNLQDNTIVVFTSDHGDLMGEHNRHDKGMPYETSAGVPFVIRYPGRIKPGKLIHTAYTTTDFAPTILGIMGVGISMPECHGINAAADFLGAEPEVRSDRIVYITNAYSRWVAAVDGHHKLVLSPTDKPWLFDLQKDPDELTNFHDHPAYREIAARLKTELIAQMKRYGEPALETTTLIYDESGMSDLPPTEKQPI